MRAFQNLTKKNGLTKSLFTKFQYTKTGWYPLALKEVCFLQIKITVSNKKLWSYKTENAYQ